MISNNYLTERATRKASNSRGDNSARAKAHAMGLEYYGFGYWGRGDKVMYRTEKGNLVPIDSKHYAVSKVKKHAHSEEWKDARIPSTTDYRLLTQHAANVNKRLTPEENNALVYYVVNSHRFNNHLTSLSTGEGDQRNDKEVKKKVNLLDSAIRKSKLPTDVTLYRGIKNLKVVKDLVTNLKKSNIVRIPTYFSTSTSPKVAQGFTGGKQSMAGETILVIKANAGEAALPIVPKNLKFKGEGVDKDEFKSFTDTPENSEYEVLLPRDSAFRLVRIEDRAGNSMRIILELV